MARAMVEGLEGRMLRAFVPFHVQIGREMVSNISDANNHYTNGTPTVTWPGIKGATKYYNNSDCSSYVTKLLQAAYGFTNSQFTSWTGESDPEAIDYYNAANANKGFDGFKNVKNIVAGDLFIMKYIGQDDTGHMTVIISAPAYVKSTSTRTVYTLHVLDCTGSPHGSSDTRSGTGVDGVGEGYMRIYCDLDGYVKEYSWNNYSNGIIYDPDERIPLFAHVINAPAAPVVVIPEASAGAVGMLVAVSVLVRRRGRKVFSGVRVRG